MFDVANISLNVIILFLRVAVVGLLYFFLWQVLQVVTGDLRGSGASSSGLANPYGQLVVTNAGQTGLPVGKIFPLSPVTTIGRNTESSVSLNDNFMSGDHARLELQTDEWILRDLNSTNGTYLNGFEVRDATSVNSGDIIRVGRVELRMMTT